MTKAKTEKRGSTRIRHLAKIPVRVAANAASQEGVTRDISLTGVFLYIDSKLTQGSQLEAVLPIPSAPDQEPNLWVRCKCRIVRVEEVPNAREFGVAATIEEYEAVPQAVTEL